MQAGASLGSWRRLVLMQVGVGDMAHRQIVRLPLGHEPLARQELVGPDANADRGVLSF